MRAGFQLQLSDVHERGEPIRRALEMIDGLLVIVLGALPEHIGFIIIEHDLDVALRVVERVTVMHNAKIFKHGTPAEIQRDPDVQRIYLGGRHG